MARSKLSLQSGFLLVQYAEEFLLDISKSSQSLSSLIISGVNANKKFKIKTTGTPASKNHSELTIRMSKQTGAKISKNSEDEIVVEPWIPKWKNKVTSAKTFKKYRKPNKS